MHWCRNVHNCVMPDKRQRLRTFAFSILELDLQWILHKCHWSGMQPRPLSVTVETSVVASSAATRGHACRQRESQQQQHEQRR